MKLIDVVNASERRLVAPIISYPAVSLTNSTALENLKNPLKQYDTLLEIINEFNIDIIMPFIDLTVEAEALGIPITFHENESPNVDVHPLTKAEELKDYKAPNPNTGGRMAVFVSVVKLLKNNTDKIVGGLVCGPFTLAGLMMGAEKLALNTLMEPDFCKKTMDFATSAILPYAKAQIKAGADFIILLDPTAVLLSPKLYDKFVTPSIKQIIKELEVPVVIHTCGNTTNIVPNMCRTGAQGLSLDGMVDFGKLSTIVPKDVVLIGNIDPVRIMSNATPDRVYTATMDLLENMKNVPNFILSTGCDLPPETPLDNVAAFCKAARDFQRKQKYYIA
ncbi:MAG TPA: methylcobamide--CoM methyltransferase [Clostridiales bacterium]|nr:methylcobamide--CoM methyltransferase [Clostridiales bacterium]